MAVVDIPDLAAAAALQTSDLFVLTQGAPVPVKATLLDLRAFAIATLGTAAQKNTGTSGNNVPLLDGANTWSAAQGFSSSIIRSGPAGTTRYILFRSDNLDRWGLSISAVAESGGDAGSDFVFSSFTDAGALKEITASINRATGNWNIKSLTLTTDLAISQGGTGASTAADARTNLGLGTAAVKNTGTSGNNVPLLDGANTWSLKQTFSLDLDRNGAAGTDRRFRSLTAGVARWSWGANSAAESGANAGSAWVLERNDDAGAVIDQPIVVDRATGYAKISVDALKFPATQVVSADPNTMDDYEVGTFTPRIDGTTAAGVGTYTFQDGRYTKIGKRIFFSIRLTWTAHTGTGNMIIAGLPFTNSSAAQAAALDWSELTFASTPTARVAVGGSTITLSQTASGAALTSLPMDTAATLFVSGHYDI